MANFIGGPFDVPIPDNPLRSMRNSGRPASNKFAFTLGGINHILSHRRKCFLSLRAPLNNAQATFTEPRTTWRGYMRTGEAAAELRLRFRTVLGPRWTAEISDPFCYWAVTEVGGATVNSGEMHYGPYIEDFGPSQFATFVQDVVVAANTEYTYALILDNGCRVVAAAGYEVHSATFLDSHASAANPSTVFVGAPITDAQHEDLVERTHALWQNAGAHLFTWSVDTDPDGEGTGITRVSSTYANAFDQAVTAYAANARGVKINTLYHSPKHDTAATPVKLAVCGKSSGGTAGRLKAITSAGTVAEVAAGFATAPEWKTATGELDGSADGQEVQFHIQSDDSETFTLYAISMFEAQP